MGESFLLTNRLEDATEAFTKAHEASPEEAQLPFQLARISAHKKEWEQAREQLNEYFQAKAPASGQQPFDLLREILLDTLETLMQGTHNVILLLRDSSDALSQYGEFLMPGNANDSGEAPSSSRTSIHNCWTSPRYFR